MVADIVEQSRVLVATSEQLMAESHLLRIHSLQLRAQCALLRQRCVQLHQQFVQFQLACQCADTAGPKPAQNEQKLSPAAIEVVSAPAQTPPTDLHDTSIEALRSICTLIDHFPLEVQVAMVKALIASTIMKEHERLRPPTALSA